MTFERKMIVGLDDIKAVTFECNECKTRTTIPVDKLQGVPRSCASCNAVWQIKELGNYVTTSGPAEMALIQAIITIRILIRQNKDTFRILLEFEEPNAN
jgi:hypothetical protein